MHFSRLGLIALEYAMTVCEASPPSWHRLIENPPPLPQIEGLRAEDSRFGINASRIELIPELEILGIGWIRFENMKWAYVSDAPHHYTYTKGTPPLCLNTDEILASYHDAGFNILNYMFLTPEWASHPAPEVKSSMRLAQPPRKLSLFGEFCFQTVARYGREHHPKNCLLTDDKISGLSLGTHFEMWNEPNLNPDPDATWGGWAGTMEQYYEMMRYGAMASKEADSAAIVTSAGYAGMTVEVIDSIRTYTYADGSHPLDYIDVINVHYYSGRIPPETATEDGNLGRTGTQTLPENLEELVAWRDRYAPKKPIWMTETGYDSAGPFGTDEITQACRLPRVVMLCLANGVDKVFVYRESGSTATRHAASGVLRDDFSRKPSFYTYGTLIRQLRTVNQGAKRIPTTNQNLWILSWPTVDGGTLYTLWTIHGTASLQIDLGSVRAIDAFGRERRLDSTIGIEITPFPTYLHPIASSNGSE